MSHSSKSLAESSLMAVSLCGCKAKAGSHEDTHYQLLFQACGVADAADFFQLLSWFNSPPSPPHKEPLLMRSQWAKIVHCLDFLGKDSSSIKQGLLQNVESWKFGAKMQIVANKRAERFAKIQASF